MVIKTRHLGFLGHWDDVGVRLACDRLKMPGQLVGAIWTEGPYRPWRPPRERDSTQLSGAGRALQDVTMLSALKRVWSVLSSSGLIRLFSSSLRCSLHAP
ncbi:hypothetical protein DPEC_G00083300 [Dallia pectoralis]|uniref:Uncharacterized protein n=1 Tax=Dallia pectoralis TaxID=75939 RepID=A0ACC2GZI6_DALPE|nr:hypothetical protein DPEC_G00083300 [Dallia pectoralis]